MEIEVELQHQKRKSDNIEGNDGEKKQRLDIETISLSKIMAQYLGLVGSAKQPHWIQ